MKTKKKVKNQTLYVTCDCYSEVLKVATDEDCPGDAFFSIYKSGSRSFTNRLRMLWKVITTGEPYEDEIILNIKEIRKLIKFLRKLV